jgi:hypothetical protein
VKPQILMEEPYRTPLGSLDVPFVYVFDATGIADGQAQVLNLAKPTQGDSDFILRRIVGINNCVAGAPNGKFNYRNASMSLANSGQSTGVVAAPNWVVLPEKMYSKNTQISFDLFNTLRNVRANCGISGGSPNDIFTSYIGFFGVKRFTGQVRTLNTPYKYREQKYAYAYDLTINWPAFVGTNLNPDRAHRFSQPINNWDFELQRVAFCTQGSTALLGDDQFSITLYDANKNAMSDLPLNQSYVNNSQVGTTLSAPYSGIFPVPTVVYPAGSEIQFDITSNLCPNELPISYQILFDGIWRVGC